MKRIKKLLAVMLAAIMVMSMGTSVFAEDAGNDSDETTDSSTTATTYSITIKGVASSNHTFSAYQIFEGDWDDTSSVLSNVKWGSSVSNASSLVSALTSSTTVVVAASSNDTSNTAVTLESIFSGISYVETNPNASAAAIASALSTFNSSSTYSDDQKEALAQAFADVVATVSDNSYSYLNTAVKTATSGTEVTSDGNVTTYTYTINELSSAGYYLVTDKLTNSETANSDDVISDYILQVVDDAELTTKTVVPSISKNVSNSESGTYGSTSTASIGDTVYFKLTITTPSDLSDYTSYKLVVEDTLSNGLTLAESPEISVTVGSGTATNLTSTTTENMYYKVSGQKLTVTITDLLTVSGFSAGDTITITYSATLNDNATVGNTGNANTATLTYSNNPNDSSSTGTTTETKTTTYTTSVTVTKVDGSSNNSALKGATFALYEKLDSLTSFDIDKTYVTYSSTTNSISKVDTSNNASPASGTTYYVLVKTEAASSGDSENRAVFSGLEAGTYLLVESVTPSGYNTAVPIEFTLSMSSDTPPTWASTYSTETYNAVTLSTSGGTYEATIQNNKGSSLPSTGGIGTTIFYIVGAILVLGAGVVLITRRRMASR